MSLPSSEKQVATHPVSKPSFSSYLISLIYECPGICLFLFFFAMSWMPFPTCLPGKLLLILQNPNQMSEFTFILYFPLPFAFPELVLSLLLNHPIAIIAPRQVSLPPSNSFSTLQSISEALISSCHSPAHILRWLPMVPGVKLCSVAHTNHVNQGVPSLHVRCPAILCNLPFWGWYALSHLPDLCQSNCLCQERSPSPPRQPSGDRKSVV